MGMIQRKAPVYDDGRTKQSFRDETDINKILQRAQKTGTVSHLAKHEAVYGDFSDFDFFELEIKLTKGREIFDDLPSEIRTEFSNSPAKFFDFVNNPKNKDRLGDLLPALAEPGRQFLDVSPRTPPELPSAPQERDQPTTEASPKADTKTPPTASKEVEAPPLAD